MKIIQATTNKWSYMIKPTDAQIKSGDIEYFYTENRRTFMLPTLINNEPTWVTIGVLGSANKTEFTQVSDLLDALYSDNNSLKRQCPYTRSSIEELIKKDERNKALHLYFHGTFDPINFNHMEIASNLVKHYKTIYDHVILYFVIDRNEIIADNHKPNRSAAELRAEIILKVITESHDNSLSYIFNDCTYSYEFIKTMVKADADVDTLFVFGSDNYEQIIADKWTYGKNILDEFGDKLVIVAETNTGIDFEKDKQIKFIKNTSDNSSMCFIDNREYSNINSTYIRIVANAYCAIREIQSIIAKSINRADLKYRAISDYNFIHALYSFDILHEYTGEENMVKDETNIEKTLHRIMKQICYPSVLDSIIGRNLYMNDNIYSHNFYDFVSDTSKAIHILYDFFKDLAGCEYIISELNKILSIEPNNDESKITYNEEITQTEQTLETYEPFLIETKSINNQPYKYISENDMVAALVHIQEGNKILLTVQARPYSDQSIEPAGGKIDTGESALGAAVREVEEELQIDLSEADTIFISKVNCAPGLFTSNTYLYLFTVPKLNVSNHRQQDKDENVNGYLLTVEEFIEMYTEGKLVDVRLHAMLSNKVVRTFLKI